MFINMKIRKALAKKAWNAAAWINHAYGIALAVLIPTHIHLSLFPLLCKWIILASVMKNPFSYPIYLSLQGRRCVIIGYGKVGRRKLKSLLGAGATEIIVVDLIPPECQDTEAKTLLVLPQSLYKCGGWSEQDLEGAFLVFACTNNSAENKKITDFCRKRGILCNSAANPAAGNFIVPALAKKPPLACAISTGTSSPYLAAKLKNSIVEILDRYQLFAIFMAHARSIALRGDADQGEHKIFFAALCDSPLPEMLFQKDFTAARLWITENFSGILRDNAIAALEEISI